MAWHPLGWSPAFFSEIEAFPSAVLAHHYGSNMPGEPLAKNGIPNYGDFTTIGPDAGPIDLLVGGTPCQSFSVAGKRLGLDDPRGNLALEYLALARRLRARWIVWENVPGVLSSHTDDEQGEEDEVEGDEGLESADFATFLSFVQECGYGFAYRVLDAQYVRVDDFARAVPQRRRRVFLVGYLGDWRRAAAVLLEPEGMRGDSAPRRNKGQRTAPTVSTGTRGVGDFELGGGLIGGFDYENNAHGPHDATGPLLKGSPTGGGRPLPAVVFGSRHIEPIAFNSREDPEVTWDRTGALSSGSPQSQAIAFAQNTRDEVRLFGGDGQTVGALAAEPGMKQQSYVAHAIQAGALRSNPHCGPDGVGVQADVAYKVEARSEVQAVAWSIMPQNSGKDFKAREVDVAQPIMAGGPVGGNQGGDYIQSAWAVRRLTPMECERLQGFPDNFTNVPWRGKDTAPDGPRYKALGNSMACNAMRWIGQRIDIMEKLIQAGRV
ncbi:DNA cytosine methyltransferase [Agrobacterium sp. Ap1]|nr:DNA cytosine methyltransferase [Agrobacterium sp. Ap1]